jgi:hypothetical protein
MAKLLGYSFKLKWVAGKNHVIADALSRAPVFAAEDHKDIIIRKVTEEVVDEALVELSNVAKADKDYQEVMSALRSGRYNGAKVKSLHKSHPAQRYRAQWDAMAVGCKFLTFYNRLVIPEAARAQVLSALHVQHTGITKTLMDARQLYFWPGMTSDIELMVARCEACTHYLPSQALEPQVATAATRPFQQFSIDLGKQKGKDYLIGADRYSGWPMVAHLPKTDTKTVTDVLEEWFIDHGNPVTIRTDGEPQFREPFDIWLKYLNCNLTQKCDLNDSTFWE